MPIDVDAYCSGEVILRIPKGMYDLSQASTNLPFLTAIAKRLLHSAFGESTLEATYNVSSIEDVNSFCSL